MTEEEKLKKRRNRKRRQEKVKLLEDLKQLRRTKKDPFFGLQYIDFFERERKLVREAYGRKKQKNKDISNRNASIIIEHVPTGRRCYFMAMITNLSDSFNPSFAPQNVYGRPDPIYTYTGTTRTIGMAFTVASASAFEATRNMQEIQNLIQSMYPTYKAIDNNKFTSASTIAASPIVKVSWSGLISDGNGSSILAAVNNLQVTPDFQATNLIGLEELAQDEETPASQSLLPLKIDITLSFNVIHNFNLGYTVGENGEALEDDNNKRFSKFPYGVSDAGSLANIDGSGKENDPITSFSGNRQFLLEQKLREEAANRSFKSKNTTRRTTVTSLLYPNNSDLDL